VKKIRFAIVSAVAAAGALALSGCGSYASPTSASCGFVIGDGNNGSDQAVHGVVYPGQKLSLGNNETVKYVNCNQRNFLVTTGYKNANGDIVGDLTTPIQGFTKTGARVNVYLGMYWTLNQDQDVMLKSFFPWCDKYQCYSGTQDGKGNINSASPGWNNMLGESVPTAITTTIQPLLKQTDDSVWKSGDGWDSLSTKLGENFQANLRKQIGATSDVMCGNGETSTWSGGAPGKGNFTCGKVRFVITDIQNADKNQQALANQEDAQKLAEAVNTAKRRAAVAAYGTQADYWLGVQDAIAKCKETGVNCTVVIGGGVSVNSGQTK
jgi:hypothetical protein